MKPNVSINRPRSSSFAPKLGQAIQFQNRISIEHTIRTRKACRYAAKQSQATSTLSSQPTEGSKKVPLPADTIIPTQKNIVFCVDGTKDAEDALRWVSKNLAMKGKSLFSSNILECDSSPPLPHLTPPLLTTKK